MCVCVRGFFAPSRVPVRSNLIAGLAYHCWIKGNFTIDRRKRADYVPPIVICVTGVVRSKFTTHPEDSCIERGGLQ